MNNKNEGPNLKPNLEDASKNKVAEVLIERTILEWIDENLSKDKKWLKTNRYKDFLANVQILERIKAKLEERGIAFYYQNSLNQPGKFKIGVVEKHQKNKYPQPAFDKKGEIE